MVVAQQIQPVVSNEPQRDSTPLGPQPGRSQLDPYLRKITSRIRADGLRSVRWVSGIHTRKIASALLHSLSRREAGLRPDGPTPEEFCVIVTPREDTLLDEFIDEASADARQLLEGKCADSFLIVNGSVVLDLTPMYPDHGKPEFSDDPTVVELYMGLFDLLNGRSVRRQSLSLIS